jgi:hypothetical protein
VTSLFHFCAKLGKIRGRNGWDIADEKGFDLLQRRKGQSSRLLILELAQDLLDQLSVFQADGNQDGVPWPGTGHVDSGAGVHFGPVKEAVEGLLVFFARGPAE